MIKSVFYLPLAAMTFLAPLSADQEVVNLDSLEAEFDGSAFQLTGDVHLQYDLGRVSCASARLITLTSDNLEKNTQIQLKGGVHIEINGRGSLKCASAEINCAQQNASFFSDSDQKYVFYQEDWGKKGGKSVPLEIQSREMHLKLLKSKDNESSQETIEAQIDQIKALGRVEIAYNHMLKASGGSAIYTKQQVASSSIKKNEGGIVVITPEENQPFCHVCLRQTDYVDSTLVRVDTVKNQIFFQSPRGKILNGISSGEGDEIEFRSDSMVWDSNDNTLTLQGNIEIHEHSLGTLSTDNQLVLTCDQEEGNTQLRYINITGRVVLSRLDPKKSLCYMLLNDGTTYVDHKEMKVEMRSLADQGGDQAHFRGLIGEVFADYITIGYNIDQNAVIPTEIRLEGNVKLLNNVNTGLANGEDVVLQYALADTMEYLPPLRQLNMAAQNGHRVLFFDKINNMQISAPGLKVTKNPDSGKEVIKGVGDVRFRFLEQEIQHIKKRFFFQDGAAHEL